MRYEQLSTFTALSQPPAKSAGSAGHSGGIYSSEGTLIEFQAVGNDITAQKLTEDAV